LRVDGLISGLATLASALNANNGCLARIAAVHLKIPDLPNHAAREAMEAEDSLIKYAQDEAGGSDWNPALHPRTGTPPNPGWFAPTDSGHDSSGLRVAENQFGSRLIDAAPATDGAGSKPAPGDDVNRPAATDPPDSIDQPRSDSFWSNASSAVRDWLQQPIPEYDLDTGRVVGERPRWQATAPYVGISAATAAILGGDAVFPFLGLRGTAELGGRVAELADTAVETTVTTPAKGKFYSVAFETRLSRSSYPGISRGAHFQEANEALLAAMEGDPQFALIMQENGVNLQRTATGLAPRKPPAGWTWHHAEEPGVIQLVPREQHAPGSILFRGTLHPGPSGRGGYAIWGRQ
jgi:hypothetical protein